MSIVWLTCEMLRPCSVIVRTTSSLKLGAKLRRYELPLLPLSENQAAVGVDLGVSNLATLSTDEAFAGPTALRRALTRLRRLSRSLSRKVKGSRKRV